MVDGVGVSNRLPAASAPRSMHGQAHVAPRAVRLLALYIGTPTTVSSPNHAVGAAVRVDVHRQVSPSEPPKMTARSGGDVW